jgi:hypothetical protein
MRRRTSVRHPGALGGHRADRGGFFSRYADPGLIVDRQAAAPLRRVSVQWLARAGPAHLAIYKFFDFTMRQLLIQRKRDRRGNLRCSSRAGKQIFLQEPTRSARRVQRSFRPGGTLRWLPALTRRCAPTEALSLAVCVHVGATHMIVGECYRARRSHLRTCQARYVAVHNREAAAVIETAPGANVRVTHIVVGAPVASPTNPDAVWSVQAHDQREAGRRCRRGQARSWARHRHDRWKASQNIAISRCRPYGSAQARAAAALSASAGTWRRAARISCRWA